MVSQPNLRGKRILIFQQRGWGMRVGHFLAKKLQAEGCELAALTLRRTTHNFIISQQDVNYKKILNVDEIIENPHKFIKEDDLTLEKICAELNLDSVWGLLQSNRLLVRSYGDKYFYSFSQNVSDKYIADYVKAYYSAVKNFLEEFRRQIILMAARRINPVIKIIFFRISNSYRIIQLPAKIYFSRRKAKGKLY